MVLSSLASLSDAGKNIASVLDLVLWLPMCICNSSHLKCWVRFGARDSRSSRLSVMKTLPSTLLNSNGVPLEEVGCFISHPFSAFRLPFFGGLKWQNSDDFGIIFRVSRNACVSLSSLHLTVQFLYIFLMTAMRGFGILYFASIWERSGCWIVSKALTRSTNSA